MSIIETIGLILSGIVIGIVGGAVLVAWLAKYAVRPPGW